MAKSLDAVLSGKADKVGSPQEPIEKAEPEQTVEAKVETPEPKPEKARDESGKFKKGEEVATTPVAKTAKVDEPRSPENAEQEPLDPKSKAYYVAAKTERGKRQDLERRLETAQRQLAAFNQPKAPDVLEDPEGFRQHNRAEISNAMWQTVLNTSEVAARDKFGDDEVTEAQQMFKEAAATNPALWQTLQQQQHPYKWAVTWAKREKLLQKLGEDPDAFIDSQVNERLALKEAELRKKLESEPKQPVPPPSLASASSGGRVTSEPTYSGPKPFSKIFPGH